MNQDEVMGMLSYSHVSGNLYWRANRGRARKGDVAGCINGSGYRTIKIDGRSYKAHRLAWLYVFGDNPDGEVDHINHDRSDNRMANLRVVSSSGNSRNSSIGKRNRSGFIGVNFDRFRNKWCAQIHVSGERIYLGRFNSKDDAIAARKAANLKYGFHENHGKPLPNPPQPDIEQDVIDAGGYRNAEGVVIMPTADFKEGDELYLTKDGGLTTPTQKGGE